MNALVQKDYSADFIDAYNYSYILPNDADSIRGIEP